MSCSGLALAKDDDDKRESEISKTSDRYTVQVTSTDRYKAASELKVTVLSLPK